MVNPSEKEKKTKENEQERKEDKEINKEGKNEQNWVLWSHNFLKIDSHSPLVLWIL